MAIQKPQEHQPADLHRSAEPAYFSHQIAAARRFFMPISAAMTEGFHIVSGGSEHCTADYHIQRENFPYFAIEFVASGQGLALLDSKPHDLAAGSIFAYGPGVLHDLSCKPNKAMTKYFVTLTGSLVSKRLLPPGPSPGQIIQTSSPEQIVEIFEQLIEAGERDTPYRERICRSIAEHLLLRIAESAVPVGTIGTTSFETFQQCRQWVDRNYRQAESLKQMAHKCGVDEAYLCRLFRRFAHRSPWQYVLRLKMRDAAQRLQVRHVRVSDVAYEFGFSDPFQFSRTFRRVFGQSPRAFIQHQRTQH